MSCGYKLQGKITINKKNKIGEKRVKKSVWTIIILVLSIVSFVYADQANAPVIQYYRYILPTGTASNLIANAASAQDAQLQNTLQSMDGKSVYLTPSQSTTIQTYLQQQAIPYTPTEYQVVNGQVQEYDAGFLSYRTWMPGAGSPWVATTITVDDINSNEITGPVSATISQPTSSAPTTVSWDTGSYDSTTYDTTGEECTITT